MALLLAYAFKIQANIPDKTWQFQQQAFPRDPPLPKTDAQHARINFLSGVKPNVYDCCPNSCLCYTGSHADLQECPYCSESRFFANQKPRKTFTYIPVADRLGAFAANTRMAELMSYRGQFRHTPGTTCDVFDSSEYHRLCKEFVKVDDTILPVHYFQDSRDVALGLSTDGFGPFKKRKSTCWPLLLFNYNLPPDIRFHTEFTLCLGVIPGPKKPKDFDSFMWPMLEDFKRLGHGISTFDVLSSEQFMLQAFLIFCFGDIPAMSMLMRMTGHNGYCPCRMCAITGLRIPDGPGTTHYVPLERSTHPVTIANPTLIQQYEPLHLPLRTHAQFIKQAQEVDATITNVAAANLSKQYGIKGVPILSQLHSLQFPISFPYDFMHLIWENLLKNLVHLWTGEFKGLDEGYEEYQLLPGIWKAIGAATAAAGATIPSAYGVRVPDISGDGVYITAEMWSFWGLYLGPALLRRRFRKQKYYDHFVQLVILLNICLQFEIKDNEIDKLEKGFAQWVQEYEK